MNKKRQRNSGKGPLKDKNLYHEGVLDAPSLRVCESPAGTYAELPKEVTLADVWREFLKLQKLYEEEMRWRVEETKRRVEEMKHREEEDAKRRAEEEKRREEEMRLRAEEEAMRREEEKKRRAEEAMRREEEKKRRAEEAMRREEEIRLRADEEAKRREEEKKRRAEEEARRKAEEEEKRRAEEDAKRRAEEEAKRKAEEDAKREAAEAKLRDAEEKWLEEERERQRKADKRMAELENLFVGQWGKLIERLVDGDLVKLLRDRGILITRTSTRYKGCVNGQNFEFDIIAHDGDTIVVVEVKTTLQPDDVKDFIERLGHIHEYLPQYAGKRILGAVGYLSENSNAATMAQKDGLFAIRATGGSASIINPNGFVPRTF